jgi:16S rRNA (guanine966-N2)-methyltransferase
MAGQLRIIAGKWARRKLQLSDSVDAGVTRPTGDRVREALFSALGSEIMDARVLDLFAGSGALGIEALSRGAQFALFCEKDHRCAEQLALNLKKLDVGTSAQMQSVDALGWLKRYQGASFDIIFLDPPYHLNLSEEFWEMLTTVVAPEGLIVLEREKKSVIECPMGLEVVWERLYRKTRLLWLRKDTE